MMMLIMVVLLVALLIPLTAVILDSQVGRALAARLERDRAGLDPGAAQRLGTLEAEVDRLAREVQRLDEESAFLQKLLEDRNPGGGALPPGEPKP